MPVTDALATLTGPGGPFEIVVEDVLGVPLQVYRQRLGSMRDLVAGRRRARRRRLGRAGRPAAHLRRAQRARAPHAAALLELGVGPGDRVAVLSANNVEWVVMFWACAVIGAACVPLNAWWKAEELEFALADSGAKVLFCDPKRWAVVRDVVTTLEDLEHVFVTDLDAPDGPARPGAELLAPEDPGALPDVDGPRGRPARDPLHLGHDRPAQGRDHHAPPGAWRTSRTSRASARSPRRRAR